MTTTICRFLLPGDYKIPKLQFDIEGGVVVVVRAPPSLKLLEFCQHLQCTNGVTVGARGTVLKYCTVHKEYYQRMAKKIYMSHKRKIELGVCSRHGCVKPCGEKKAGCVGIFCKQHADANNLSSKAAYKKRKVIQGEYLNKV